MSIGRDTIDLLIKLRASGHLAAHAAVLEVGTQQLSDDFLTNQEKLAQLAAIFGIKNPSFVPSQGELTHLAGNAGRARDFWLWLGFDYTVVDVDGNPDLIRLDPRDFWLWLGFDYSLQGSPSSITLDLNYDSAPPYATQKYDLVTNFGTTEHVANQLNAFRVIHNLTKPGGIMIHQMPAQGSPTHGLINYNLKFFWILAKSNGYRILHADWAPSEASDDPPDSIVDFLNTKSPSAATLDFEAGDAGMTLVMEKARDTPFVAPIDPPRAAPTTAIRVPDSVNWSVALRRVLSLLNARTLLALASLVIYTFAVFSLHQSGTNRWYVEFDGAFSTALSNAVSGAPLGFVYGPIDHFLTALHDPPMENAGVNTLAAQKIATTPRELTLRLDGNGIGYVIFATMAMNLFGPHIHSVVAFFLFLVGVSAVIYVARFRDQRLLLMPATFTILTLMLITPLATVPAVADQLPIGGVRYFSVAAIMPTLYLIMEFFDARWKATFARQELSEGYRRWRLGSRLILMMIQVCLLVFAYFARASAGGFLMAVVAAAFIALWLDRHNRARIWRDVGKMGVVAATAAVFVTLLIISMPRDYWDRGQILGAFWDRAAESLGISPHWPSPAMRAEFDCTFSKKFPEGLKRGTDDNNKACIWYAENRAKPEAEIDKSFFGPDYETGMRHAVVRAFQLDPMDVLLTVIWYKPRQIVDTVLKAFDLRNATVHPVVLLCASLQCVLFLLFIVSGVMIYGRNVFLQWLAFVALGILSIPQYLVAWASLHLCVDIIFCVISLLVLIFAIPIESLARLYRPRILKFASSRRD
ncbi:MAG: methyltransferase domain-containing protein [Xanthobacteraceae bacterium]